MGCIIEEAFGRCGPARDSGKLRQHAKVLEEHPLACAQAGLLQAALRVAAAVSTGGLLKEIGGSGGLVSVDAQGNVHMPFNSVGMYRGVMRQGEEPQSFIFC